MSSLTAAEICTLAAQVAKCPGFTVQSGQALNFVLDDLVLHRDLKMNRVTQTITAASGTNGPFTLPADYLRTYDLFFLNDGLPYFLNPVSTEQYDMELKIPAVSNYPYEFMTILTGQATQSTTDLYIYPQSSGSIDLTHRYFLRRAAISSPQSSSTIPWFPDQDYLMHATAMRLMKITDDARYTTFVQTGEDMLRTHLIMEGDEQKVVREVKLDPRRFQFRNWLRPTKSQPW